jgi:hypothetical protein
VLLSALSSGSGGGGAGAGAGLSIDDSGDIQLGNDGAGRIDFNEFEIDDEGDISSEFRVFSNKQTDIDFDTRVRLNLGYNSGVDSYSASEIELRSVAENTNSSVQYSTLLEMNSRIEKSDDSGTATITLRVDSVSNANILTFLMSSDIGFWLNDSINSKGIEEADDYSANKTANSYITPNWLKYQTGYNSAVPQYFTHDGAGNFEWVDI